MVSYAPLDFDVAAQAAATAAAVAAASSEEGGGVAGTSGEEEDELDESLLRRVLYVSGEEKPEHVRSWGESEGWVKSGCGGISSQPREDGEAGECEEGGMREREGVTEREICLTGRSASCRLTT